MTERISDGYPRKRAQTRRRLINAGMAVLSRRGPDGATVGEISGEAGMASATFYNHFPSLMDLVEAVTDELVSGVEIGGATLVSIDHDPAIRVLIGTHQLLDLAKDDPRSASAFVTLLADIPKFRDRVRSIVSRALADGVDQGRFRTVDLTVLTDAVLGAVVQWMRTILAGLAGGTSTDRRYLESTHEQLRIMLSIVGIDSTEAEELIDRSIQAAQ